MMFEKPSDADRNGLSAASHDAKKSSLKGSENDLKAFLVEAEGA